MGRGFWGVTALLHDLDFERYPDMDDPVDGHPRTALRMFREWGYPEHDRGGRGPCAVPRHPAARPSWPPRSGRSDELTGLIMAVGYVRPSKDLRDVEVSSVRKKWKDKLFAAAVNRQDIEQGAAELGLDTWEHVAIVLEAMKGIAADLGLDGRLAVARRGDMGGTRRHGDAATWGLDGAKLLTCLDRLPCAGVLERVSVRR